MIKISRKASTILSLVLAAVFLLGLIFIAVIMPHLIDYFLDTPDTAGTRENITKGEICLLFILSYAAVAAAVAADICVIQILRQVRRGEVFTAKCVSLIRTVSWCLIIFGLIFIPIGYYFRLAFAVALAAGFMGLCVRVVKNAFEEAVAIKEENDLTV
ncbi:MAG: DUF2975 domain-containing protein [Clostridia bacterium]|nr:DUF2975 domain-containing protein [Clostridia bacterium]